MESAKPVGQHGSAAIRRGASASRLPEGFELGLAVLPEHAYDIFQLLDSTLAHRAANAASLGWLKNTYDPFAIHDVVEVLPYAWHVATQHVRETLYPEDPDPVRAVLASAPVDVAGVHPANIFFFDDWARGQMEKGDVVILSHMVTDEELRGRGVGGVLHDFVTQRYVDGTTFGAYVPAFSESQWVEHLASGTAPTLNNAASHAHYTHRGFRPVGLMRAEHPEPHYVLLYLRADDMPALDEAAERDSLTLALQFARRAEEQARAFASTRHDRPQDWLSSVRASPDTLLAYARGADDDTWRLLKHARRQLVMRHNELLRPEFKLPID